MSKQKQFIEEEIRSKKYGINKDGIQEPNPLAKDLQKSVQLLSTELYAKDIHFIFELIQNAEDNQYHHLERPDLEFRLLNYDPTNTENSDGCLCIFNNEIGFTEENIIAICAVGGSTKNKKDGYIGEKGIEFKSVFIVSNSPHIYSNNFHIKFLENDPNLNLSYIVPYWLEDVPEVVQSHHINTSILLPLKTGKRQKIIDELQSFSPETILFLTKIQSITICLDENIKDKLELIKYSDNSPIIQLLAGDKLCNYWLKKEIFSVPDHVSEGKRQGITERDVIVAFSLDNKKENENGRIFAFLPTEIFSGLPFLVNADFILSSNRETIQIDLPWNLWLRDCIANVVVSGFLELIQNSEHRTRAYSFIPLIKELTGDLDFLSPICEKIISRLTDQKVVLTENSELALPKDTRLPSSKIRVLFQDMADRPQALRNLNFVAKEISKYTEQLKAIGVNDYSLPDLYNALSDRDWLQNRTIDWLIDLYLYLLQRKDLDTNALQKLPILPTQDIKQGRKNVASSKAVIYFYSKEGDESLARQIAADPEFSGTYLLSEEFSNQIADNEVLILWLKKELCIRDFSLSVYLVESLIPYLKNSLSKLRSEDVLSLTKLILENWKNINSECKRKLKATMLILLDSGRIIATDRYCKELVFPVGYESENGWHLLLQEERDRDHLGILSESYLQLKEVYTRDLQEFLNLLCVKKIPSLKTWKFVKGDSSSQPSIYKNYIQEYLNDFHPDATRGYENYLDTWMTPSFFHDPGKRDRLENRKALLHWLEEMIKTNNTNQIEQGRVFWFRFKQYSKEVPSGLLHYLTTTPWINSSQGLKKPGEVFRKSAPTFALFGNNLNYLEDDISIDLCKLLGIYIEITPEIVLEYLQGIYNNKNTVLEQVEKLYEYLNRYGFLDPLTTPILRKKFRDNFLIYLPEPHKKWYRSDQVVWEDASAIFGDRYGWLESAYNQNLRRFFTDKLEVKSSPDVEEFTKAWLRLQEEKFNNSQTVETFLEKIYVKLTQFLSRNNEYGDWWVKFKNSAKIWTKNSGFMSTNSVFVADDRDLFNLFSNDLNFAWKPKRFTYNEITPFFEELSLKLLSHSVQIELVKINEAEICTDNNLLTEYSKKLLCYLLYNQHKEIYQQRFDEEMLPNLLKYQEFLVSNLIVKYRISEFSKEKNQNSYWDKRGCLYLKTDIDQADLLEDVAGSLSRIIWGRSFKTHHEDSVQKILGIKDEKRFKKILDKKNWDIPSEERKRIEDILLQDIQPYSDPEPPLDTETGTSTTNNESDQTQRDSGNEDNQTQQDYDNEDDQAQWDSGNESDQAQWDSSNEDDQTQRDSGNESDQAQWDSSNEDDQTQRDSESATRQRANQSNQTRQDSESATRQRTNENAQRQRDPKSATNGKSRSQKIRTYIYVEPNSKKSDEQEKKTPHELKVECESRKHVCAYEKEEGRVPREMDQKNPGYDIISHNPKDNNKRYIEVKGISGEWNTTGVGLSNRQFRENIQYKQNYWLYIVEYALDPNNYRIYRIQNPVFTVDYFMFDSYWKILDLHPNKTADPTDNFTCGAKIHCGPVLGIGLITDVNARGDSKILKVKFTDNELWLPLNLRYMYLVEEADG